MRFMLSFVFSMIAAGLCAANSTAQSAGAVEIELTVPKRTPLRVALQQRVRVKHVGEPVRGILTKPVYAFDTAVIPAGTELLGRMARIDAVPTKKRFLAFANADFTPPHSYGVVFDSLVLPDGSSIHVNSQVSPGTAEVIHLLSDKDREKKKSKAAQAAAGVSKQLDGAVHTAAEAIRSPGRFGRMKRLLASQLPFRRQYLEAGTVFNVTLEEPLDFGFTTRSGEDLVALGTLPAAGSVLEARLGAEVSSATATRGTPVEAIVTAPLFSSAQKLVIPANSKITGEVVRSRPAGKLHRRGQLRFDLQRIQLPDESMLPVRAHLEGVEVDQASRLELDAEGGAQAAESRMRYAAAAASIAVAAMALEPDRLEPGEVAGSDPQVRAAAGGSGMRLLGAIAGLAIRARAYTVTLGTYGAMSSVYSLLLSKGKDVTFPKHTPPREAPGCSWDLGQLGSSRCSREKRTMLHAFPEGGVPGACCRRQWSRFLAQMGWQAS